MANSELHRANAGGLAQSLPAIDVRTPNEGVMAFWSEHPAQETAAVVDEDRPIGLLNRHSFMEAWARPFQRELFGRRPCDTWMDREPLVVDANVPLRTLAAEAVRAGAKVLKDGFITVREGRYAGIGTGFTLLEATSAAEADRARQIRESIDYASVIQRSQLEGSARQLAEAWPDHALIWEPRDVVGGDCFFFRVRPAGLVGAVLDCTGHGVPGAFMTVIALSLLDRAMEEAGSSLPDPGALMGALNVGIKRALGQLQDGSSGSRSDDGLDGACFVLPAGGSELRWAGAKLPLLLARRGGIEVHEPSRTSVGYRDTPDDQRWETRVVALEPGAIAALVTDGVTDQIGGPRGIAFGKRRVAELIFAHQLAGPRPAAEELKSALFTWQGTDVRRDDMTALLLGVGSRNGGRGE